MGVSILAIIYSYFVRTYVIQVYRHVSKKLAIKGLLHSDITHWTQTIAVPSFFQLTHTLFLVFCPKKAQNVGFVTKFQEPPYTRGTILTKCNVFSI